MHPLYTLTRSKSTVSLRTFTETKAPLYVYLNVSVFVMTVVKHRIFGISLIPEVRCSLREE